jgi:hypothetical protein
VRLLSQIWILKKRFSDFDKMHNRVPISVFLTMM